MFLLQATGSDASCDLQGPTVEADVHSAGVAIEVADKLGAGEAGKLQQGFVVSDCLTEIVSDDISHVSDAGGASCEGR